MSEIYRHLLMVFLALLITSVILPSNRAAAAICQNLPPSKLLIYSAKVPAPDEKKVPVAELRRASPSDDALASAHTMMLTIGTFLSWYDIQHRIVARDDGTVCDAPELVRIGFGEVSRKLFIPDVLAGDTCTEEEMRNHEAAHTGAIDTTIDQFIDERRPDFESAMKTLKQTPAPDAATLTRQWEEGLRLFVDEAKNQLLAELRKATARVDDPATLTALETACNGKIKELERHSSVNP